MALPTINNTTNPRSKGYDVRINDVYYRLAITPDTPMRRQSAELQAQRVDDSARPEDIIQSFGVSFTRADFSGGEGLQFAHLPTNPPNAFSMFWNSVGVNLCACDNEQRSKVELLHDVDEILTSSNTNLHIAHDKVNNRLYISDGNDVKFTDTPFASSPSFTTENPHAGETAELVQDLAFYDDMLYVAVGSNGLHRRTGAATYESVDIAACQRVWNVKQRILWVSNNILYELTSPATPSSTARITIETGHTFTDVYDAGANIIACASDGYLYSLALDEETGQLGVSGRFSISGETPLAITGIENNAVLSTYQLTPLGGYIGRLWRVIFENGVLAGRNILKQFGDIGTTQDFRIHSGATRRNNSYMGVDEGGRAHLWRYDYATGGLSRAYGKSSDVDSIVDVRSIGSKLFWGISTHGFFRQSDSLLGEGYLISPLADNGTADDKAWAHIVADVEDVGGSRKVELYISTDPAAIYDDQHFSWDKIKDVSSVSSGFSQTPLSGYESRYIAVKAVIKGSPTVSPKLNSFSVRAFPGEADIIYDLPVNISDLITRPYHKPKKVPGLGRQIESSLRGIHGKSVELEVLSPYETIIGTVINISKPIIHKPLRGSPFFISQVQVRGRRAPLGGVSQSPSSGGVSLIGVTILGGIES